MLLLHASLRSDRAEMPGRATSTPGRATSTKEVLSVEPYSGY